jgi:hypothetical protein
MDVPRGSEAVSLQIDHPHRHGSHWIERQVLEAECPIDGDPTAK